MATRTSEVQPGGPPVDVNPIHEIHDMLELASFKLYIRNFLITPGQVNVKSSQTPEDDVQGKAVVELLAKNGIQA